jgi:hypothetical protein
MRKLFSLMMGLSAGAAIGAGLVVLLGPRGKFNARLKRGWEAALAEARQASQERRRELQAELAVKRLKQ